MAAICLGLNVLRKKYVTVIQINCALYTSGKPKAVLFVIIILIVTFTPRSTTNDVI